MKAEDAVWLIKSSGRIMGPYTKDQVTESLRTREFVMMDEASLPGGRWKSIREHQDFSKILEEIRIQSLKDPSLDNFTGSTTSIGILTDDPEATPTQEIPSLAPRDSRAEIVVDDMTEKSTIPPRSQTGAGSYGLASDARVQQQVNKKIRYLWVACLLVVIGALIGVVFKQNRQIQQNQVIVKDDFAEAMRAMEIGDMNVALEKFKNVYAQDPNNKNLDVYLGALLIQYEGQTVLGRRLLTRSLETQSQFKKQAWTGIGLANLVDGEWGAAEEAFKKALAEDAFFFPALINLGIVSAQKRNWVQAKNYIQSALDKGAEEGIAYLILAEVYIAIWKNTGSKSDLLEAQRILQDYVRTGSDYNQEAQLILAYVELLQGAKTRAESRVNQLLDLDPEMTNEHRHNLFISPSLVSWNRLLKYCEHIRDELDRNARTAAFMGYCQLKAGSKAQAKSTLDGAVAQAPRDSLIQSIYGYVLKSNGLEEQASVVVGKALELNSKTEWLLPLILQGRFCAKNLDWDCAKNNWTQVLANHNSQLTAIAGMGQVQYHENKLNEAKEMLTKGLTLSPEYIPLRRLAKQMDVGGI